MVEQNNIETVWLIEDNELKKANKVVSKINYNGTEIAVLKQDRDIHEPEYLFKDKDNEYWKMGIAGIDFKKFINVSIDNTLAESKEYCDKVIKILSSLNLGEFFEKKIENSRYFNKCELAYISKYYPNMYEKAKESRERIIAQNEQLRQEEKQKVEQEQKQKVKEVNTKFKEQLKSIKKDIATGKMIQVIDLEFYKDGKYENGKTTQNCVLFLAKQYGINIPLATQGFISNRLTAYHFEKKIAYFRETSNKKCSTAMGKYLDQIYEKVKKEYMKQKIKER